MKLLKLFILIPFSFIYFLFITVPMQYIFCKHKKKKFIRNIYGDEIIYVSPIGKTYRSWHECQKCKKLIGQENLVKDNES